MPKPLPSGLKTFDASDTVRRIAQNENIEAIDKLFSRDGHRHTGNDGDAPQIGKDGIASGAIQRHHLNSGRMSQNVAKYKPVEITGGVLSGYPTAPYFVSSSGQYNWWRIPNGLGYPQTLSIHLEDSFAGVEGISFEYFFEPTTDKPFNCKVEVLSGDIFIEVYNEILDGTNHTPFIRIDGIQEEVTMVRITINGLPTNIDMYITRLAVYSRDNKGWEEEALEDRRPWGLPARMHNLLGISSQPIIDNGDSVTLGIIYLVNPIANAYFAIHAGTYPLVDGAYLYAEFKHYRENVNGQKPVVKKADFNNPPQMLANGDGFLILYRFAGKIYLNPIIKAKLQDKNGVPISLQAAGHGDELLNALQTSDIFTGTSAIFKADKESIVAGGSDKMAVEVHLTDWQGEVLEDASESLIVDLNGLQQTVQVSKGKGSLVVSSDEPGEFQLRTMGLERNAQLKVVVVDGK